MTYYPLKFADTLNTVADVRKLLAYVLNKYTVSNNYINYWRKLGSFTLTWKLENGQSQSTPSITFNQLTEQVRSLRKLDIDYLNGIKFLTPWMDSSVEIGSNFHHFDGETAITFASKSPISASIPIEAKLDREGAFISSMQLPLQSQLLRLRNYLVNHSHEMFKTSSDWLINLMAYFNTAVSLIDTTLIQIYYKAKYDSAAMGWNFIEADLGSTKGRRMDEKLKWIGKITGNPLNDARDELKSFKILKQVRNHINHFDPPLFAYTIEDVAVWLNYASDLGILLWKIRDKINANLTNPLIELILCDQVEFVPNNSGNGRKPQDENVGYRSIQWK